VVTDPDAAGPRTVLPVPDIVLSLVQDRLLETVRVPDPFRADSNSIVRLPSVELAPVAIVIVAFFVSRTALLPVKDSAVTLASLKAIPPSRTLPFARVKVGAAVRKANEPFSPLTMPRFSKLTSTGASLVPSVFLSVPS